MAGMPADPVGPFIPTTPLEHKNFSEMDVLSGSLVFMMMVILVFILMRLYRQYRLLHYEVPARDIGKGHKWYMVDSFEEPGYCVISQCRISHGAQCDSCGVCVDDHNMKKANAIIKCKALSETKLDYTPHHWTQATVPYDSNCYRCYENCGLCQKGCNFFCSWCHRTAHSACLNNLIEVCDLGEFKNLIVPPNCVTLKWAGMKGRRHLVVGSAKEPLSSLSNWNPLIVVANRKSGNNDGEYMLRAFRSYLNPTQVIDLNEVPPENALEWCHILPTVTFKVLVCGGDGTVSWVLDAIEKLHLENCPQVGILPLGTGNDLSRVLGWGEGYTNGDVNTSELLRKILTAKPVHLDRWKVEIRLMKSLVKSRKEMTMNNYASIGVDALVTLNFHRSRESRPWLFAHRFINKLAYFTYGTKDVLERECKHLEQKITVHLDDVEVALPEIEGLVVLNIASWGGGCQPWTLDREHEKFRPARYDDGYLEVMVLYSSFHIAQLQVGLASPHRLGQAKKVKIFLHGGKVPMQVDGEPWEQKYPAEINIQHHGRATMLASHPNT